MKQYRKIDPVSDQLIVDGDSGAIIGLRNRQDQEMIHGFSDNVSGLGGGLTAVTGRNIVIPAGSQAMSIGGITISSGSITAFGEFVAMPY